MSSTALATVAARTGAVILADSPGWTNKLQIKSETSSALYTVAQRTTNGQWCCSCRGWIMSQKRGTYTCKHLSAMMPVLKAAFPAASEATKAAEKHQRIGGR